MSIGNILPPGPILTAKNQLTKINIGNGKFCKPSVKILVNNIIPKLIKLAPVNNNPNPKKFSIKFNQGSIKKNAFGNP
ncbi:MAG: hypothetical protein GDA38_06375 [Hormoscilla sp. SP12CHS1]|nr:hypothetical protein [Hormoscilla sp. SP12CHS1]